MIRLGYERSFVNAGNVLECWSYLLSLMMVQLMIINEAVNFNLHFICCVVGIKHFKHIQYVSIILTTLDRIKFLNSFYN